MSDESITPGELKSVMLLAAGVSERSGA